MKAYEELAELADAPRDQALLADALTYAGHYQAALDGLMVFNQEENQGPLPRDYEWVLKEMMLAEIVNERGITQQDRHAVVLEPAPTEAAELDQVLRQDALAPMVWWNLGVHRFEAGDISDAALPFLAAALITGWDANAWAHAFAGFFFQARIDLLPLLLSTGERMSQGQMVPALTKLVKGQDEKFPRQQFLAVLRQQLESVAL